MKYAFNLNAMENHLWIPPQCPNAFSHNSFAVAHSLWNFAQDRDIWWLKLMLWAIEISWDLSENWVSEISCIATGPGARPTKHISIEFEIRWKFKTLYCKIYAADHNDILHTSRQCHCRDVCKISLWSVEYIETRAFWIFIEFRIRSKYA